VRLVTRNDTSLAIGLIVGAIVVFQQPLHFALDFAREVETRYNLDLVPALTIISGVFIFHQYRKRQLSKAEASVASADAARSRARSEELERLMVFSQALANTLDLPTLQQVLSRNLPAFADLIRRALAPLGYTILLANNAADALAIAEADGGPIHLLLTDIVMPDLDGPELAQRVKRLRPEIKVLFVSGFIGHAAVDLAAVSRDAAFLAKPFTPASLAAAVRGQFDVDARRAPVLGTPDAA
jgi:CheY-like chemotaxis protein